MYELCKNLNKDTKDMLWYGIVGVTDLIVHCRSGTYDYDDEIVKFNDEVTRLNPNIYNKRDDLMDDVPLPDSSEQAKEKDLFKLV